MQAKNARSVRGFSLFELLIVVAIVAAITTMAIPKLLEAMCLSRETAAMKAITTIHTAQAQYQAQFGRFAPSLKELGPSANKKRGDPSAAALILADLAAGEKGGYRFTLHPTEEGYAILAQPAKFGTSGRRTFFSDETAAIRQNWSAEPAGKSPRWPTDPKFPARTNGLIRHTM
ncbi:MAG: prepilin-type N-terminal cleavage/methylation domain-containing protein [Bryobacteraceae bacterium]